MTQSLRRSGLQGRQSLRQASLCVQLPSVLFHYNVCSFCFFLTDSEEVWRGESATVIHFILFYVILCEFRGCECFFMLFEPLTDGNFLSLTIKFFES